VTSKRSREYLTAAEMERLLTASRDPANTRNPVRDHAILLLMFRHGLRVTELCDMKVTDVNVNTKEVHVNRLKGSEGGPHPLHNGESSVVKAWLAKRAKMEPPAECDTLFISERKKPIHRSALWAMVGKFAKAAGLDHLQIHPHMLRHSTGYDLVNKGKDIRIIQAYLGHRAITSTTRYTQLDGKRFEKLF
jgi:type 1 fimbriae regulatory protein FimB